MTGADRAPRVGIARSVRRLPRLLAGTVVVVLASIAVAACGGTGVTTLTSPGTTTPGVTLATETSPVGRILATGTGFTVYDFAPDTSQSSTCVTSVCVELWPPVLVTGPPTVAPGLHAALAGTVRRPDGALQATYAGHPLYTWIGDSKRGAITGQALLNSGGYWYVISAAGAQIDTAFNVLS